MKNIVLDSYVKDRCMMLLEQQQHRVVVEREVEV